MSKFSSEASGHPDLEMHESTQSIEELSNKCVELWNIKLEQGILVGVHFKDFWRKHVPKIYSPEPNQSCLDWNFQETRVQEIVINHNRILLDTLERFMCGGNPREVFQDLMTRDKPPSVCGKVFKLSEPTYSCRECCMDATCVLCVDCFKRSAHRNHKYKMGTSSGGGCCDCGDTEAWRSAPFCELHEVGAASINENDGSRVNLPADIAKRARITFSAVLEYTYRILTVEHVPRLPSDLQCPSDGPLGILDTPDTFCTVLFNDESHTFEQVINTLTRLIVCPHKDAIEYVTNIDREGRAVVKCSSFQHCNELKYEIEKFTSRHGHRALKVLVVHAHVVAHQIFACKLLEWLQEIMSYSEGFRTIFSEVAHRAKPGETSVIEGILHRDSNLWKSARTHWHRLIISGMLMEYETKKTFAKVFSKNYGTVIKDFMRDDHDHSFSVASMSVQVFTVPTLAHHLIAHEDILFVLLNTYMSEVARKCNALGKLEFERNVPVSTFKRAQYILYDLRYLLSTKPTEWTDPLRKGFLQGLSLLLNLLNCIQGMDPSTRQLGHHMEYEPEWESAFNLHLKLSHVVSLAIEWCGSDRVVLIKAYRATLKKFYDNSSAEEPVVVRELADHSATCIVYDVSTQPVSIHLPLSRFLAGLHLHLEKYGLTWASSELQIHPRPSPEQLIEPVLRAQVMISQVHAGMWRRNGYSLLNQIYFYHNVRCRTEMLDRDIVLLQIGASLIESNEFVIHLLNKFGLLPWADPDFEKALLEKKASEEDSLRQTIALVEEFLELFVNLMGERHMPGVGRIDIDDRIQKEIIHQLCVKPLAHSELNKSLPEDANHETGLERVIDKVAEFKKPAIGSGRGVYELKPEMYNHYDVFFYHYTREELSKSEEAQRKRRKAAGELECCPPPPPPPLTESFQMMANLAQCDVTLHVIKIVLERSADLRARSHSEGQVHRVLHLIGYALLEEQRGDCPFFRFTERADRCGIEQLLESLSTSPRVEAHKDLFAWTLNKYREVAAPRRQDPILIKPPAVPVETTSTKESSASEEKQWRAKMAAQKRAKIMAQMTAMQKNFMKENAKLFEMPEGTGSSSSSRMDICHDDISEMNSENKGSLICIGPKRTVKIQPERVATCILCQEDETVSAQGNGALVLAAFIQQSTVLSDQFPRDGSIPIENPLWLGASLGPAPHTSTCGHVMHASCWQKFYGNVLARESRRPYRLRQPSSFNVDKHEFLCPLCECLSNTVLPLLPPLQTLPLPSTSPPVLPPVHLADVSFEHWLQALNVTIRYTREIVTDGSGDDSYSAGTSSLSASSLFYTCPLETVITEAGEAGMAFSTLYPLSRKETEPLEGATPSLSPSLQEKIQIFTLAAYTRGLMVHPHLQEPRVPLMTWQTCAYTIHSLERLLRESQKPLLGSLASRHRDCIEGLVRVAAALPFTWRNYDIIASHALRILGTILREPPPGLLSNSILDWDPFGVLVPLCFALPGLFPSERGQWPSTGGGHELNVLKLLLLSTMVRSIIIADLVEFSSQMEVDEEITETNDPEATMAAEILAIIRKEMDFPLHSGPAEEQTFEDLKSQLQTPSSSSLLRIMRSQAIPFLRCSALFFHFLTGAPAPKALSELCEGEQKEDEYLVLCNYLGLGNGSLANLLTGNQSKRLIAKWARHSKIRRYMTVPRPPINDMLLPSPLKIIHLVDLPTDYSELINAVSSFNCPNSDKEDSRYPTMCLTCGEILCSQSYCCQTEVDKSLVGACTSHAHRCGSGVGIFLRVRECEILLLASPSRGCFMSPPYLDQYGETDQGLRRGNPLRLCPERYRRLQMLWLGHGIYEEIARALELNTNIVSTQWQHL